MKSLVDKQLAKVLHHLYINPLEKCNLKCKICYTRKTDPILSEESILEFINRYQKIHELQTVTFCGGEVFSLKYFPHLVNVLTQRGIFVQTITNGTIDRLNEIKNPNLNNLIVSLDGLKSYHDKNRGLGNFDKSMTFLKKARKKGFHTEIFSIVTKQNYPLIDQLEKFMEKHLGPIDITYHPRKPMEYLLNHPVSNIEGTVDEFDYLGKSELIEIIKTIRSFFYKQNFHEVIPDVLNDTLPSEPNLTPFSTIWKTQGSKKTYFLPMSPERGIKKMLAQGIGNCFAISKSFRNLKRPGSLHLPEFLMLEWYRENAVYTDIMSDVEKLFVNFGFKKNWPVLSLKKLFKKYLDLDLEKAIVKNKLFLKDYDQLFVNKIESKLPKTPLFLVDFPSKISPLCKPQKNNPFFAERFECYVSGIEIGNGNAENIYY